jgi:hypothetical protein
MLWFPNRERRHVKAPFFSPTGEEKRGFGLRDGAARLVVIVLVPVAFGVPAVLVLVPPLVTLAPAALARFAQFVALAIGFGAVAAMFFDGFVQFVLGMSHAALASVIVFGVKLWDGGEQQRCRQNGPGQQRSCHGRKLVRTIHELRLLDFDAQVRCLICTKVCKKFVRQEYEWTQSIV